MSDPSRPEAGFAGREANHRVTQALTRRRGLVGNQGFPTETLRGRAARRLGRAIQ